MPHPSDFSQRKGPNDNSETVVKITAHSPGNEADVVETATVEAENMEADTGTDIGGNTDFEETDPEEIDSEWTDSEETDSEETDSKYTSAVVGGKMMVLLCLDSLWMPGYGNKKDRNGYVTAVFVPKKRIEVLVRPEYAAARAAKSGLPLH